MAYCRPGAFDARDEKPREMGLCGIFGLQEMCTGGDAKRGMWSRGESACFTVA